MKQKLHFISGLPRSGSTLLAALLRQNPRFHANMSGPLGALFQSNIGLMSAGTEISVLVTEDQKRAILKGLFTSFYESMDKEVIFDTNRIWCSRLPAILTLFPDAKVICTVRSVAWIMDSIERLIRANPFENTRLFADDLERNTTYSRVETLALRNRLVGFAWTALKEAFYGEQADKLLIVEYDLLAKAPDKVLPLIYQFIGEPLFEHDFDNVTFDAAEFDALLGVRGLHKVNRKVQSVSRRTILPPDLFERYSNMEFWRDHTASKANVISTKPAVP